MYAVRSFIGCMLIVAMSAISVRADTSAVPRFIDPGLVVNKASLDGLVRLRFVTTLDFPPFNFADENKKPTGFNVDLARAICENLDIAARCEIQAVPWEELEGALEGRRAEAVIAGFDITPEFRERYDLSQPYFRSPARFIARNGSATEFSFETVSQTDTRVGVLSGSAHAAYIDEYFADANVVRFPDTAPLYNAIQSGEVDYLFGDGISFSYWLAADVSQGCCQLVGDPLLDARFFGRGMVVAVRAGETILRESIDAALKELEDDGTMETLFVRYFPINPFAN
ncbi:MAG: transporter substrate-binding domain-containing protein [Pseudomonadota bacterium]